MSKIDDLEKIQELKNKGILTDEEFENEKNKILGYTKNNEISEDLKKIQELRDKGILTDEEFEIEKQKILNIPNNNISNNIEQNKDVVKNIPDQEIKNKKNKKIKYIISIIAIIMLLGIIIIFFNTKNKKIPQAENNIDNNISNTNLNNQSQNNEVDEEQLIVHSNLKYKLEENADINSYILFQNNQFEICEYYDADNNYIFYRGNFLQYIEEITFKIEGVGYGQKNEMAQYIELEEEYEQTGILSDGGRIITLLGDNENIKFKLTEEQATIKEIPQEKKTDINENPTNKEQNDQTDKNTTDISTNNNTTPKKETVKVPDFTLGNKLEDYTKELDNLGIPYKVVKVQDLDYEDNTVIKIEHRGEHIEKGTTITITVADNQYDMNIYVNTEYLVRKAGLNNDGSLKEVSLLLKINGTVIFNETTPVENSMYDKLFGIYTGKPDNLNIEVTIEGKTLTLVRNIDYSYSDYYDNTPQIVINYFGGMG